MMRRKFCILVGLLLGLSLGLPPSALAASYLMTNGRVVNPILSLDGEVLPYMGPNLKPGVDASGSDLSLARLKRADLVDAVLSGVSFTSARIRDADFSGADLSWANLSNTVGSAFYSPTTNFEGAFERVCHPGPCEDVPFDPVAAGWTLIPEPAPGLSLLVGLVLLSFRRRL